MTGHTNLGDRLLVVDVATGTGEPGPSAAGLVPHGQVTLTDLAERMLARVTRPGGRVGAAVWAAPEANPSAIIILEPIARHVPVATAQTSSSWMIGSTSGGCSGAGSGCRWLPPPATGPPDVDRCRS